ncbi:hypothetical protein [Mesorhizobium sp.]|uniref:hypothetical protein n=1 Tax=Mesorhizobium sp. TaxID=1871066 RepID=UPI00120A4404|nr:hypothetical protein [Mesorhizobium sp.]TJV15862.1 MAG: hypothetical protein E5Y07_19510 [Mesorhizobium sp.]
MRSKLDHWRPYVKKGRPEPGSAVKVWFDKATRDLVVEMETGEALQSTFGVILKDAVFQVEVDGRGRSRCIVTGKFVPEDIASAELAIGPREKQSLDFYWWRDKVWPIARARIAFVNKPHGGFLTTYVVGAQSDQTSGAPT